MIYPQYDNLSEQELKERLAKADKFSNHVSRFIMLALLAFYVWLWKSEIAGFLVKIGAELPGNG